MPSPRHWNPGLLRYRDRLWMTYRYHLKDVASTCATAICELDQETLQPKGKTQRLPLDRPTGAEHCEDARLFIFGGEPYISYTEMSGYRPGVDYVCVMKYARLRLRAGKWSVVETWRPNFGKNTGYSKEKNWVFFEHAGAIHCIYADSPKHVVLKLDGAAVSDVATSCAAVWYFGPIRGGTSPVRLPDGNLLCVFHSSLPTEIAPHYVRYYAGAYVMSGKPPFEILRISMRPIAAGSEVDGHKVDPRYAQGWKPFVAFPGGLVQEDDSWLCSLGVNDWGCVVACITTSQLDLGSADGKEIKPRYFRRPNGSVPVIVLGEGGRRQPMEWLVPRTRNAMVSQGYMMVDNPMQAQEVSEFPGVTEIRSEDYENAMSAAARSYH